MNSSDPIVPVLRLPDRAGVSPHCASSAWDSGKDRARADKQSSVSKFFRVKKTTRRHAVYRNENRTGIRFDWRTKNGTLTIMQGLQKLNIAFFRTEAGNEPVREWLRALPAPDRKEIGDDIRTLQFGWPLGMPLVEKLNPGLWEVRTRLDSRIARVIFTIQGEQAVLLHGFIKKSRRISKDDMETAKARLRQLAGR